VEHSGIVVVAITVRIRSNGYAGETGNESDQDQKVTSSLECCTKCALKSGYGIPIFVIGNTFMRDRRI
jgi:hypothetical protein